MKRTKGTILIAFALALLAVSPLSAQEKPDNIYLFRFVPEKDMFYVPYGGNDEQLERLVNVLQPDMERLRSGQMYICVSSYGAMANDTLTAARMAYLRCHRVKSELITRGSVTEAMFLTERHIPAAYGVDSLRNVVVVTFPTGVEKVAELAGAEAAARVEAYNKDVSGDADCERIADEKKVQADKEAKERAEQERLAAEQAAREKAEAKRLAAEREEKEQLAAEEQARLQAEEAAQSVPYRFALRANLLRWVTLTPDVGFEWRINRDWGIQVNGSWTSWNWNEKDRRYALWEISPEVRYYIGKEKRGYIGAMYHAGQFNYKLSATGKQGDLMGGGITGGYQLKLNRSLSLDFSLGIGCTHADYDKYTVIDGVRMKRGKESKNYWGVNHAGITLVWRIGR